MKIFPYFIRLCMNKSGTGLLNIRAIMCLLELSIVFVLAIAGSHSSQGQCTSYRCQANVSTNITIPCGDYPENKGVMFTYYNDSDNGEVLSTNTTLYYKLINVTALDSNTRIVCKPDISQIGEYTYDISVLYPPQIIKYIPRTIGYINKEVTVNCPLDSNPRPVCLWEFYTCDYDTLLDVPTGITYLNNNCSFIIPKLTFDYLQRCFECYAWNNLGSSNSHVLSLDFKACQEKQNVYIVANPVISTGHKHDTYVEVQEGQDLNLTCYVTAISCLDVIIWETDASRYIHKSFDACSSASCLSATILSLYNVTSNDAGTYTCFVPEVIPQIPPESITVVVVPSDGGTTKSSQQHAICIGC